MTKLKKHYQLYLMMIPIVGYFLIFSYYPLYRGFIISLQKFRLIGDTPFIGFANYEEVLNSPAFYQSAFNTLVIGGGIMLIGFFLPLIIALSLNEVLQTWFKKVTQLVIYMPHLFSWVVVGGIWILLLSPDGGLVNEMMLALGAERPINFLANEFYARWVMILSAVWKDAGFICILYLAAIVGINPSLYEAARIDGASRWQLVRHITIPSLYPTMKVILLLNMMGVLRIFDQIYIMKNNVVAEKVDVLMIYMYEQGILQFNMGIASAASFLILIGTFAITLATRYLTRYDEGANA